MGKVERPLHSHTHARIFFGRRRAPTKMEATGQKTQVPFPLLSAPTVSIKRNALAVRITSKARKDKEWSVQQP